MPSLTPFIKVINFCATKPAPSALGSAAQQTTGYNAKHMPAISNPLIHIYFFHEEERFKPWKNFTGKADICETFKAEIQK